MENKTIGLLVMAYGTPENPEQIEAYYTHIRHGRKPSEALLHDLKDRYQTIGGVSPLARITREQGEKLTDLLKQKTNGVTFKLYIGLKHTAPFIEDAVAQMAEDGIEEAVSLILAPHYSVFSVKIYNDRALAASQKSGGPKIHAINSWYDEPKFISFWSEQVNQVIAKVEDVTKTVVIFSAHSLPEKILANGDPYPDQVGKTAQLIADQAQLKDFAIGWQSAGKTGEPWIGPDVQDLTRRLYQEKGYESYIYCPIGFVAEHLEVLYDNDQTCKHLTAKLGVHYYRPEMPNANPKFIESLADVVAKKMAELDQINA
ncbi:ferrochelatase [Sporolactobacillus shoreae]|uniref:Coproporphyrin III ferrochelatase n=1 Tax=Sporolactobacillus shoreae TaxID=1465501 RepID=A0A4Z0GK57_9BACL|nr:ferrochelatase [Sporolactobacillus shoreae]TGA97007.1 ferrochelatase [Sporolactobacillus shoreae]